jgi:hypothetical protein
MAASAGLAGAEEKTMAKEQTARHRKNLLIIDFGLSSSIFNANV